MIVNASSSGNIKPGLVMEAFWKSEGKELSGFALEITREDTFTDLGGEEGMHLVPLDAVGAGF